MYLLYSLIVVSILIVIFFEPWKSRRLVKLSKLLYNDYIYLPIIGHGHIFRGTGFERMQTINNLALQGCKREHGSLAIWLGPYLFVGVADADIASAILNDKQCLEKPAIISRFANEIIGNASIFASVHDWRPRRKTLVPLFSLKNLKSFVNIFECKSKMLVDNLTKVAGSGDVCMWDYVSAYSMEAACETTLGISVNILKQTKHPFCDSMNLCMQIAADRILQPWLYSDHIYRLLPDYKKQVHNLDVIHSFTNNIIAEKRSQMNAKKQQSQIVNDTVGYKTVVELMLESEGYTDVQVREEALLMIIAGTDTSAVNACFVLMLLALHPEVQEKVYKEITSIFKNDDIIYDKLGELKYTEAVIKETLRLYPPLPLIARTCERDITISPGITLYSGTNVFINIWGILRNPRYWGPKAEEFKPERFLSGNLNKNAFPPFSLGVRSCLGAAYVMLSAKTVLSNIIRRFVFEPATDMTKIDVKDLKHDITLKHANFLLKFKQRK